MKSCYRLKKNFQYRYVYSHSQSVSDVNFALLFCKSNRMQSQVGFSVSKKYGHAVCRNRIRRQMKAAASQFMPQIKDGFNLIFIPCHSGKYRFDRILLSMQKLLEKADLLKQL